MKLHKIGLWAILAMTLSSCGTVPQSRQHFIELLKNPTGMGSSQITVFTKKLNTPFNRAVANIKDKLEGCIPGGYVESTMRGNAMTSLTVKNNQRIEVVSPNKAEVTIQQFHSNTFMQSKGGFYLLAADIIKTGKRSIEITFYTSKHYAETAKAIEKWAAGSNKCHGIGGNP